ncbi:MAG: FAD-dependent oxidoreductase [Cytophagales bacterium]|nr:FAD-dependent oxidoreductase [Armatimonadota bacterium]
MLPLAPYYYRPRNTAPQTQTLETDVCIYGGTPAGVAAALQLRRMGKTAILLEPSGHLGGMSSSGLGNTDTGNKAAIGGIAHEFYQKLGDKYGVAEEWNFEPHVAEQVFGEMIREAGAPVYLQQFIQSVTKNGLHLLSLTLESGLTVRAKMFVDATYEGDLLAKAGVQYFLGRESNAVYEETLSGVQVHAKHQFDLPVDPYIREGDPSSGLLPGISAEPLGETGTGDRRIQAYNFRLCLTQDPQNRIPFEKPADYDPLEYVLLARYLAKGWPESEVFRKFDPVRNNKVDKNNCGAVSTDYIGRNFAYPEADYTTREAIFQAHVTYQKGLMWFLGNDPSVPEAIRVRWSEWGLCQDEFPQTGGWPHQLYVREARRMVSDYVMTESNCRGKSIPTDSIGLAAYTMDSHNCDRFVRDGRVWNEGDVQVGGFPPYPISYRSLVPKSGECANLLVPVCLSASHIAYGSIRMEPVFMILGQSAATAAALALDTGIPLQDLNYNALRTKLLEDKQILTWEEAEDVVTPTS